jgi:hypothetical protein
MFITRLQSKEYNFDINALDESSNNWTKLLTSYHSSYIYIMYKWILNTIWHELHKVENNTPHSIYCKSNLIIFANAYTCGMFTIRFMLELGLWYITPLSTIFQLYRGGQFSLVEENGGNHRPVASHGHTILHNVVPSTRCNERDTSSRRIQLQYDHDHDHNAPALRYMSTHLGGVSRGYIKRIIPPVTLLAYGVLENHFTPNKSKFVWRVHKGHKTLLCISIPLAFSTKVNEGLVALEYNDSYMIKTTCCSSRLKAQLIRTIIIGKFTPKDLKRLYKLTPCR